MRRRIERHLQLASAADPSSPLSSFAERRFIPHISGLERLKGKRVLEIGGTDSVSLEAFFRRTGAYYMDSRLESNPAGNPRVVVGDFMDLPGRFDLVISLGVFEIGAIDVDFETLKGKTSPHTFEDRIRKLSDLTTPGGSCVIGTISSPCFFDEKMIRSAGFTQLHRESPFYSFMNPGNPGLYGKDDRSELIILKKKKG
ncbi:MAG: class I SAM-dependent methyltransferase [Candidatus Micrarchaeia archaeon]